MEIYLGFALLAVLGIAGIWWLGQKLGPKDQDTELKKENQHLHEELARAQADLENKNQKQGELYKELENEKKEKNELSGKNKTLFVENENLKGEIKHIREKLNEKEKIVSRFEEIQERREKEFEQKVEKLEHSRERLEKEQARVIREDEEKQKKILEEKNRVWNDHENSVLANLREICQKPEIGFQFYENTNLPADFDGKLKPDFLVHFLGQYIIFDAKKSKDIKTYIPDQVKKTATKCKNQENIYSTIFFVVPQEEIGQLKKLSFFEEGFSFFVISENALEPILANFKRITEYEKIQEFDPQDRENIVNIIANYDRHISFQNAANILLTKESVGLMSTKEALPEDFQKEIETRKQSMRPIKLKESDVKKISQNIDIQKREVGKLTSPKVAIESEEIENVQKSLEI